MSVVRFPGAYLPLRKEEEEMPNFEKINIHIED